MKKILPVLMVFSFLLMSWSTFAYDFTISGTVNVEGAPLPIGFIQATTASGEVQEIPTDENGFYSLTFDIEDGTVEVITVTTFDFCTGDEISVEVLTEGDSAVVDFEICEEISNNCQAGFSYDLNEADPLLVDFSNQSFGNAETYLWDFGDGNTSTEENPSHTYAEEGIYEVTLSIAGEDCESTSLNIIFLDGSAPCNCNFEFDPVCVEDADGNLIPFPNPCFAECEGYTVDDFVDCEFPNPGDCHASFSYTTADPSSLTVDFTDNSVGEPTTWAWDFGDGNTSTEQNPSHTYAEEGDYNVTLTITGEDCEATTVQHICVGEVTFPPFDPCEAVFGYFNETELGVQFLHFSISDDVTLTWDFGDGNTSNEADPFHVYAEPGEYVVTLTVTGEDCENTHEELVIVGNVNGCNCNFEFDPVCVEDDNGNVLTFPNACFAECEGYTADDFVDCEGGCNCSFEFDPVCVEDENGDIIPFPNPCFAECEGYSADDFVECDFGGPTDCFTYSQNDPDNPLEVNFETASGDDLMWSWDFGDGNISSEQNPNHTYAEAGVYDVTLIVSSVDGEILCIQTVFVDGGLPCNCDFEFDPVCVEDENGEIIPFPNACFAECEGYTADDFVECDFGGPVVCEAAFIFNQEDPASLTLTFENFSFSNGDLTYLWDFGDGNTSTEENPTHTYAEEGIYDVTLTIAGEDCESSATLPVMLGNGTNCPCDFEFDPVCVLDEMSGVIIPFLNACFAECEGYTADDFVECDFPVEPDCFASFFYSQDDPTTNTVNFSDLSSDGATAWSWDFGDGNTSNEQNPTHTYADGGIYDVTLTITTDDGCTATTIDHICIGDGVINYPFPDCQAFFFFEQDLDDMLSFEFSDLSFGENTSWSWDFGDGNTSDEQNPSHTYSEPGFYNVTLMVASDDCESVFEMVIFADDFAWYNSECNALFLPLILTESNVVFVNTSSADAVSFAWDFGDGNTSTDAFPEHEYAEVGSYDVTLTITTDDGCTSSFTMTINMAEEAFFGTANSIDLSTTNTNDLATIAQVKSYPNPVVDQLTIEFESTEAGLYQVELVSVAGQLLRTQQFSVTNGNNTLNLNVGDLPSGLYITRLSNAQNNFSLKFVK